MIKKTESLCWSIGTKVTTFVENDPLKTLYLMRHGQALSAEAGQSDFSRKLSEKGEWDMEQMGNRLMNKEIIFDGVLCSPTERTQKTAGILVQTLGLSMDIIEFETRLVNASPDQIFFCIMEMNPAAENLLVVAHNPGISTLAGMLCSDIPILSFQPGGICALKFDGARTWVEAGQMEPTFDWYLQP
jgi:phosphohistidine phosphatase